MDSNGLRFWMLANPTDWLLGEGAAYDRRRRSLRLASVSKRLPDSLADLDPGETTARRNLVPAARDGYGNFARWDEALGAVVAGGALPGLVSIYTPPAGETVTDLTLGFEGILYIALSSGTVILNDPRARWDNRHLDLPGFRAWRLAASPNGGVWVLDRESRRLARLSGRPCPVRPGGPRVSRPCTPDEQPPLLAILPGTIAEENETPIGLACSPSGQLAVLASTPGRAAVVRLLPPHGPPSPAVRLRGALQAYSLAWVSDELLAVLLTHLPGEAPVYPLDMVEPEHGLRPVGNLYPLRKHDGGPFQHGLDFPSHYGTTSNSGASGSGSLPLDQISRPSLYRLGKASGRRRRQIDSGSSSTIWHRLYLEANLPPGCGVRIWLASSDNAGAQRIPDEQWYPHDFGQTPALAGPRLPRGGWARAVWVSVPSEVPLHPGLLDCPPQPDRTGLFTVLIQRGDRAVRQLRGRYLYLRAELFGDGHNSPEIAGLRAYASRFSYRDQYLPELYRENCFGPEADARLGQDVLRSTAPDFLERYLDIFEGMLTPLEDLVADSYLMTAPSTVPTAALDWLGTWLGMAFDAGLPQNRRRPMLARAMELYRLHGTLDGLRLALDLATGGLVRRGDIFVLEDFRLRRTFVTILGADLMEEDDPLVGGLWSSGNSIVGDTLFLGDENQRLLGEFLALYRDDVEKLENERRAVAAFFDRLAHRVSVLVRRETPLQELVRIRRVIAAEVPAHIRVQVLTASPDFLVGVSSLVGVDTHLGARPPVRPVRVSRSTLGVGDILLSPTSLDPRLEQ
jgi:phage tail-like protein